MLEGRGDGAQRLLVTGAGVGVDLGQPEYELSAAHDCGIVDLRRSGACLALAREVSHTHHLAADTGVDGSVTTECAKSACHNRTMPQGVRNYGTDNPLLRHVVGWEPWVFLAGELARTCASIARRRAPHRARIEVRTAAGVPTRGRLWQRIMTAV